ncbi:DUF6387 family protein [Marinicella sp. S1101]|uniref:DUF6387 family protein n=1 Tax=Marinicella marina TaxID=2996016 RepID=UPI00226090E5|nr:DUF6387 family protein [Marinicella marina]MCX7553122.1 DUF6387 family protein [Marinicella marina]MDJ1138854.1 DUF6387 family protein [Marinicella marina]
MNKKLERPNWLQDPTQYDVCLGFTATEWFEQIAFRKMIDNSIGYGDDFTFSEVFQDGVIVSNEASKLQSIIDMIQKGIKPNYTANLSEFSELGLVYPSVWSQSISDVKLRHEQAEWVKKKVDVINDSFPIQITDRLSPLYHSTFGGIASVNVDMFADKEQAIKEFSEWFDHNSVFFNYDQRPKLSKAKFKKWSNYRTLGLMDLKLWLKKHQLNTGKHGDISKYRMKEWLFPDYDPDERSRLWINAENSIKDIEQPRTFWALEREMLNTKNSTPKRKTTVKEFMASKGYVQDNKDD